MFNNRLSLVALALLSLNATAQKNTTITQLTSAVPSDIAQSQFIKSVQDDRSYDELVLENGLRVVVVSDPSISEAAVSLTVGVGQYHDPESYQGLAHFLEHMIFQGSKAYPKPNALKDFISKHGGQYNAATELQMTSYFFSLPQDKFDTALTMLSDAIVNPLFDKENIDNEINAVDQEWQRLRQQDSFVINRTAAVTVNPEHPIRKFGAGNKASLKSKSNKNDLYAAMANFYKQYYSANLMTVTLVGGESTGELKSLAKKHFAKIKNLQVEPPIISTPVFTEATLGQEIKLQTKVATDLLLLQFPLSSNFANWQFKPNAYIQMLLASQEPGSLAATLTEQGLIEMMLPMLIPNSYGVEGTALVQFMLTEKGKIHQEKIVAAFFDYVELIKETGITEGYAAELKQMLNGQFESYQKPPALHLAMQFSRMMQTVPARDILHFDTYFKGFNSAVIRESLSNLTLEKARIWHISDDEKTGTSLQYAQGSYHVAPLSDSAKKSYADSGLNFKLHSPSVEEEVATQLVKQSNELPSQVVASKGISAWLKNSEHFTQRQGVLGISIESAVLNQDVKNHTMLNLLNVMMIRELQRLGTRAQQRHQINLMAMQNAQGNLAITLSGKTGKQDYYAEQLFKEITGMEISESRLEAAKKLYLESLENLDKLPLAYQSELHFGRQVKTEAMLWTTEQVIAQLKQVNTKELASFHNKLVSNTYIDIFAFGGYDQADVQSLAYKVRETFGPTSQTQKPQITTKYAPQKGYMTNDKQRSSLDNVYYRESYIYAEKSAPTYAALMVLNQFFNSSIFNTLRTEKQMAYAVGSKAFKVHDYPAFSLFIESANTSLPKIKSEFDNFIMSFYQGLEKMDEKEFEVVKDGLLVSLEKQPENVFIESQRYFEDWLSGRLDFSSRDELIHYLKRVNKSQIIQAYQQLLIDYQGEVQLLQIKGPNSNSEYFEFEE
ncbi:insulinase family protein [Pseudoalteromonas maricaloris]|uniref:insulinase family protein n=1 Tax=Pseudoalteromonas maricaloris TaxID=184924 RepID=UPI00029AA0B7|nr:insulinase family protein [Pseudoalteromonas flavipulchra]